MERTQGDEYTLTVCILRDNTFLTEAQLSSARKILTRRDFLLAFGLSGQYDSSRPGWESLLMPHSRNATPGRDRRTHTDSPFHFSNRETGLKGAMTCATV